MKLVWLFKEHRDTVDAYRALERKLWQAESDAAILTERNLRLEEDNKKLALALEAAQTHIQSNPGYLQNVMDLMERYQREVLQEIPMTKDQQPEWLTPGEDTPERES